VRRERSFPLARRLTPTIATERAAALYIVHFGKENGLYGYYSSPIPLSDIVFTSVASRRRFDIPFFHRRFVAAAAI
jgi:hypothetical protein